MKQSNQLRLLFRLKNSQAPIRSRRTLKLLRPERIDASIYRVCPTPEMLLASSQRDIACPGAGHMRGVFRSLASAQGDIRTQRQHLTTNNNQADAEGVECEA
ncbi:hypothetical protein [Pseudomonas sp. TWI929]|uniref:hypothetical protein n=1 Tax=Pseudomonas sp. TWI929 TaxID=3136795 RepID=UPI0032090B9F